MGLGEKASLPFYTQVVLFTGFTFNGDFGLVGTKDVLSRVQDNIEITIALHARKFGPVQIDIWLPTHDVWNVTINMDFGLSGCGRSKRRCILSLERRHA